MARIAIGGFQHETNTFAPTKADPAEFHWQKLRKGVRLHPLGPVHA